MRETAQEGRLGARLGLQGASDDLVRGLATPLWAASNLALPPVELIGPIDPIRPANDPVLVSPLPDRIAISDQMWTFRFDDGVFTDPVQPYLAYTATQTNGHPLPSWLTFDPESHEFYGTPPSDFSGRISLRVTARDPDFDGVAGQKLVTDDFMLKVQATDQPEVVHQPQLFNVFAEDSGPWTFSVPAGTITDPEHNPIFYSALLEDGYALPTWISFDARTQTFTATPPPNWSGILPIIVTGDDGISQGHVEVILNVTNSEDAPQVVFPLDPKYGLEGSPFDFAVPYATFADPDNGDTLTYSATLADGSALPDWVHFDPATLELTGTPPDGSAGDLLLSIWATDPYGQSASTPLDIDILPMDRPPVVAAPIPDTLLAKGQKFTFKVPTGTFTDVDSAILTYTASQSSGAALPSWLHFNAATDTFSGKAPAGFSGPVYVAVHASDGQVTTTDNFVFANNAVFVSDPTPDQTLGKHFWSFTLPADTFGDFDSAGLTYQATLQDGSALPSWLSFDPATRTISGTAPVAWDGMEPIRVTASDGTHTANDDFNLTKTADLSWDLSGSIWGRDAPSEIHYRFDKFYYSTENSWGTDFGGGFSAGPIYGGLNGHIGLDYGFQAGLLVDFDLKPDIFDLHEGIDINTVMTAPDGATPAKLTFTGAQDNLTSFTAMTPSDAFFLHLFAGVTGHATLNLDANVYGGFATPDIDLGFYTIDVPDITFSTDLAKSFDLINLPAITLQDGKFTAPSDATAVDLTVKTGDALTEFSFGDGIGKIGLGAPSGIDFTTFDKTAPGLDGLSTLHVGGTSDPFFTAQLDLDQLMIKVVMDATGVDLTQLFHSSLDFSEPGVSATAHLDSDFGLTGSLRYKEDAYFTPMVFADYTTSFGQTINHLEAGTEADFYTPEGEGTFTVNGSYTSEADISTTISLVVTMAFDYSLLKASLSTSLGIGPISWDTPLQLDLPAALSGSVALVSFTIPIFSNTDHYVLSDGYSDSYVLAYERFRTVFGSGDSFTLTSHQTFVDGNSDANAFVGNDLGDTMTAGFGNDTLTGGTGADSLNGEGDNDVIVGGGGADLLLGGDGNDRLTLAASSIGGEADGGAGNDTINGSANADFLAGGDGSDLINALAGMNTVDGGAGNDTINAGVDADSITGGIGADRINAGEGANTVNGGAGDDTIVLGSGDDTVIDLQGALHIIDAGGNDKFTFGDKGTSFTYTGGDASIHGGTGADSFTTGSGDDYILSGGGNDTIRTGMGADRINTGGATGPGGVGGAGDDVIDSGLGDDYIKAYGGNDLIDAGDGANYVWKLSGQGTVTAGSGNDTIQLAEGNDSIQAGDGNNSVGSNGGKDLIVCGSGSDTVFAGDGNDTITGGGGRDYLYGQGGSDVFVYTAVANSTGAAEDLVSGFDVKHDRFDLTGVVTGIDHHLNGDVSLSSFTHDLQHLANASRLAAGHAVVISATGELASHTYLIVDANGLAGYQAGADYLIELDGASSLRFTIGDFI